LDSLHPVQGTVHNRSFPCPCTQVDAAFAPQRCDFCRGKSHQNRLGGSLFPDLAAVAPTGLPRVTPRASPSSNIPSADAPSAAAARGNSAIPPYPPVEAGILTYHSIVSSRGCEGTASFTLHPSYSGEQRRVTLPPPEQAIRRKVLETYPPPGGLHAMDGVPAQHHRTRLAASADRMSAR
jgi:hypothetical protein